MARRGLGISPLRAARGEASKRERLNADTERMHAKHADLIRAAEAALLIRFRRADSL